MSEAALPNIPHSMRVPSRENRAVFVFPVPKEDQADVGFNEIGMIELSMDEESRVIQGTPNIDKTAGQAKASYELAKTALVSIDGVAIPAAGPQRDDAWFGMRPIGRSLVLQAYNSLHAPSKKLASSFLKGRRMQTG